MYLSKLQSDGYAPRAGHGISGRGAMALVPEPRKSGQITSPQSNRKIQSTANGSASNFSAEPTDYFEQPITGSSQVFRRRGRDAKQKPGLGVVSRYIPG
jgi:hypothetical protein